MWRVARGARSTRRAVFIARPRASVAYCAKSSPAIAKQTVFAPSQGPACTPWTLRVMIWHPVSSVAVHAGPWLGANTVCFAIAGALVPLIEIVTGELFAQYATLARDDL